MSVAFYKHIVQCFHFTSSLLVYFQRLSSTLPLKEEKYVVLDYFPTTPLEITTGTKKPHHAAMQYPSPRQYFTTP